MHHHQVEALEFVAVSGDIPELLFIDFHATGIGDGCIDKRIHSLKAPETFFVQFEQQLARAAAHIEYPVSKRGLRKKNSIADINLSPPSAAFSFISLSVDCMRP